MTDDRVSRRRVLKGSVAFTATGLAGCLGGSSGPLSNPIIQETAVSGRSLVVTLQSDHSVSTLNVIGPSGSQFRSASVATGATSVEVPLFDYQRGWYYEPGEHELVAVSDDEEVASTTVELEPELTVTDVQQYTEGRSTTTNRANLLVTVENTGTGPTWVYHVGYRDALYPSANNIPTNEYARSNPLQNLEEPESASEVVLAPDESTELVGMQPPLLLPSEAECGDLTVDMTVIVSSGVGPNGQEPVQATLGGELYGGFPETCRDIQIDSLEGTETDE